MTASEGRPLPDKEDVQAWQAKLQANADRLAFLKEQRGLSDETIRDARLGWTGQRYTIPIYAAGKLVNVRRYAPQAGDKMTGVLGHNSVRLYMPAEAADAKIICVSEGELDLLKTQQEFIAADIDCWVVSGTGGAGNPPPEQELEPLRDKHVYIAYDCDEPGRKGAEKLAVRLSGLAASAHIVDLALEGVGDDLTDWFVKYGRSAQQLWQLMQDTAAWSPATAPRRSPEQLLAKYVAQVCDASGDPPSRNVVGFDLACQLRDERYSRDAAAPFLERYADSVADVKSDHPYSRDEALRSLDSAYAEPPREPSGVVEGCGYSRNDAGNAERLVSLHGKDLRWVPGFGGWLVWNGSTWLSDSGQAIRWARDTARSISAEAKELRALGDVKGAEQLGRFGTASANASKIKAMLELARAESGMTVDAAAFDADPRLFVARSGALVLGDDQVTSRQHRREDYALGMAGAAYDPAAKAPAWETFVEQVLPDSAVRAYVQKLVGYSLIGGNPERLLIFMLGPSSTGKSTFIEVLSQVLGSYAGTFDLTMFRAKAHEGPRPDILDVINKRLVYTSEANSEWRLHADVIKRMTGDDTIKARTLYVGSFVEKPPAFTPWVVTNRAPRIEHADAALWRRLVAVPFRTRVAAGEEDVGLRARLLAEGSGVLAWAVRGWEAYAREGLGGAPAAVSEATAALRASLSELDAFLAESTESGPDYRVSFADLHVAYEAWCYANSVRDAELLSGRKLAEELEARGFENKLLRVGDRGADRKVRHRMGLRLAVDDDAAASTGGLKVVARVAPERGR